MYVYEPEQDRGPEEPGGSDQLFDQAFGELQTLLVDDAVEDDLEALHGSVVLVQSLVSAGQLVGVEGGGGELELGEGGVGHVSVVLLELIVHHAERGVKRATKKAPRREP